VRTSTLIVAAAAVAVFLASPAGSAAAPEPAPAVKAQVEAGRTVFEATCANSMCHGSGGAGGRGPALAHRPELIVEKIRDAIQNGRSNTAMPPFKDVFDAQTQAGLVAYVQSIASDGAAPSDVVSLQGSAPPPPAAARTIPSRPWLPSTASSAAVDVGGGKGTPARGVSVFFDATRLNSCRACHSYGGAGGPVGPDIAGLGRTPDEVYARLTGGKAASAAYPAVVITLRDGSRRVGVKRDESATGLRFYDVGSVPPVSRRLAKAEIVATTPLTEGAYDHRTLGFAKQDLRDVSAFLGQNPGH
jgi:mono/diheme cytochrome c family protein